MSVTRATTVELAAHIDVRGNATSEEIAAVLAVLAQIEARKVPDKPDGYALWRQTRLNAVAASPRSGGH